MFIENSTDEDATVKVSPGGPPPDTKGWHFRDIKATEWSLPRKKTISPPWPPLPCQVYVAVKNKQLKREVRAATVKRLKLVKNGKGYEITAVRERRR